MVVNPRVSLRDRLAANLRQLRESRAWSQQYTAERCSLSERTIQAIEGSRVAATVDVLERLCDGLGVEPCVLLAPAEPLAPRPRGRPPILRRR